MKPLPNSNNSRLTPSRISNVLNNFPTLQISHFHKLNIPQSLFTLRQNIGGMPPKSELQAKPSRHPGKFPSLRTRITIEA